MAALLLVSGAADAAGLGRMSVMSSLGQPLRAEIELLSVPADEIGNVEAKIASPEAFRQARIDRSGTLSDIQMSVEKRANGQPIVRIASSSPVNDPFVDLLIELNWSSGRILREYTVLLDPARDAAPTAETARTVQVPISQPVTPRGVQAAPEAKPAAAAPAKGTESGQGPTRYGPVKSGETLRGIAAKVLPPDVTLDMMMASLYQSNKGAFQGNANLLKKGAVLNVPERDAVMRLYSPSQARKLLQEHTSAWHEMQGRVADQAARNVAETSTAPAGKGAIVTARPEEKPGPAAASKDVLKLSKGTPTKTEEGKSAQRIQSLEEEVAAKSRALQEAQDRVNQLERTVEDLQKLVALRAKEKTSPEPVEASGTPTPPPVAAPTQPAEPPKQAAKPKPAVPAPVQPPAEEPGFLSSLLASPLYLGGLVAALGLGALLWIYMVGKRRKKGLSDFEQSVMTGGDQFKTSIFKTGGGPTTQTGATTQSGAATDFSRLGLGNIDTHEVDPIAEAEVYMAYGRDAQAEEILKEALSKDPYRHEIVLKLLEIYATRQDTPTFETQASELYANLGDPSSQIWQKAAEMGRKLDPTNPLYRVYGEVPSLPESPATAAAAVGLAGAAGVAAASSFEMPEAMAEPLGSEAEVPSELAEAEHLAPEMSLDETRVDQVDTDVLPAAPEDDMIMQFDMPAPAAEAATAQDATDQIDLADLSEAPAQPAAEFDLDAGLDALQLDSLGIPEATESEPAAPEFPAFGQPAELGMEHLAEIQIPAVAESIEEPMAVSDQLDMSGLDDLEDMTALPVAETFEATEEALPEQVGDSPDLALPELDFSDIDLDLDSPVPSAPEPAAAVVEMADVSEIDPDLLEEVNTKLDLARAYQEMGDREGAREILEEVLKEGDSKQKQEAERLIASL